MPVAVFVAPYLLEATARFVHAAARLPGAGVAVVTHEPAERLPATPRTRADGRGRPARRIRWPST